MITRSAGTVNTTNGTMKTPGNGGTVARGALRFTDKQLACLLSLFASAPIPWQLVEQCLRNVDAEELEESRDDKLINLHLLQRKEKGIYQLHPLLREFYELPALTSLKDWFLHPVR
ncbi:hypothetical protein NIES4073_14490 [Kalymmatonema gypsitolerans NIES-4073]|nr:hypothetical protein NIES4073_14490 [Scytonema sp. NIES-4073]